MFRYDLTRAVRERRALPAGDDQRRTRFGAALKSEIKRLREQHEDEKSAGLKELAAALAAIDGRGSAAVVLDVISIPDTWDQYIRLAAAERLLMAGVVLPATTAFALLDSILERTAQGMQDSDWDVLNGILALCPFVDDPAAGIAKVRDVLSEKRIRGYKLRGLVTALGESRSDAAFDLLYELASDAPAADVHAPHNVVGARGSEVSLGRFLQHQLVQCQVRHCSLQAPVLALTLLQAPCPWLTFIPPYSRLHR